MGKALQVVEGREVDFDADVFLSGVQFIDVDYHNIPQPQNDVVDLLLLSLLSLIQLLLGIGFECFFKIRLDYVDMRVHSLETLNLISSWAVHITWSLFFKLAPASQSKEFPPFFTGFFLSRST